IPMASDCRTWTPTAPASCAKWRRTNCGWPPRPCRPEVRAFLRSMRGAAVLLATAWGALLLHFQLPGPPAPRIALVVAWAAAGLATALMPLPGRAAGWRALAPAAFALGLLGLALFWASLTPSHDRDWADDVARLLEAAVEGD